MARRKWKRKSLYKKSLILCTILFIVLGSIFLGYVYNSMIIYERNLVDNYIKYLATSGKLNFTTGAIDTEFNIESESAVLKRTVEMYQWEEDCSSSEDNRQRLYPGHAPA